MQHSESDDKSGQTLVMIQQYFCQRVRTKSDRGGEITVIKAKNDSDKNDFNDKINAKPTFASVVSPTIKLVEPNSNKGKEVDETKNNVANYTKPKNDFKEATHNTKIVVTEDNPDNKVGESIPTCASVTKKSILQHLLESVNPPLPVRTNRKESDGAYKTDFQNYLLNLKTEN